MKASPKIQRIQKCVHADQDQYFTRYPKDAHAPWVELIREGEEIENSGDIEDAGRVYVNALLTSQKAQDDCIDQWMLELKEKYLGGETGLSKSDKKLVKGILNLAKKDFEMWWYPEKLRCYYRLGRVMAHSGDNQMAHKYYCKAEAHRTPFLDIGLKEYLGILKQHAKLVWGTEHLDEDPLGDVFDLAMGIVSAEGEDEDMWDLAQVIADRAIGLHERDLNIQALKVADQALGVVFELEEEGEPQWIVALKLMQMKVCVYLTAADADAAMEELEDLHDVTFNMEPCPETRAALACIEASYKRLGHHEDAEIIRLEIEAHYSAPPTEGVAEPNPSQLDGMVDVIFNNVNTEIMGPAQEEWTDCVEESNEMANEGEFELADEAAGEALAVIEEAEADIDEYINHQIPSFLNGIIHSPQMIAYAQEIIAAKQTKATDFLAETKVQIELVRPRYREELGDVAGALDCLGDLAEKAHRYTFEGKDLYLVVLAESIRITLNARELIDGALSLIDKQYHLALEYVRVNTELTDHPVMVGISIMQACALEAEGKDAEAAEIFSAAPESLLDALKGVGDGKVNFKEMLIGLINRREDGWAARREELLAACTSTEDISTLEQYRSECFANNDQEAADRISVKILEIQWGAH